MPTRKNQKSKKSNNKFRKTRSKRQTRNSKKKTRSKRGGGQFFSRPTQLPEPETPPECPICTEEFNQDTITTECGHKFDKDCLRLWCRQHRGDTECPLCRAPIGRICRELLFTDLEKTLFDAINAGKIDFVEDALADSINDDGTPKYDNNMLLLDINVKNKDGDTPLILAAKKYNVKIVDLLLKFGADVDELNDDGDAAFHVTDNDDIINLLIEVGTEYYDPDDDAVESSIFEFWNRGGKKNQKRQEKGIRRNDKLNMDSF